MRVEHHRAVVLGGRWPDPPASAAASMRATSHTARPGREPRQPAVAEPPDPFQLRGGPCRRARRLVDVWASAARSWAVVEPRAVVIDRVLGPEPAQQWQRLVERSTRGPARATPNACCSTGWAMPRPNAGSARPPESTSRVAHSFATRAGLRPGRTETLVPSLIFCVRAAANGRAEDRIGRGPL